MKKENINREWIFHNGKFSFFETFRDEDNNRIVNLPHDYMLENDVMEDSPAGAAMGYYSAGVASYTKLLWIPEEWGNETVILYFDGIMMNAEIEVNGNVVGRSHYGYTPVKADLTNSLLYGKENRITVTVNPSMQPNSRWYTGAGIYRSVYLLHGSQLHVIPDGIYAWTKEVEKVHGKIERAYIIAQITVKNDTGEDRLAKVKAELLPENFEGRRIERETVILVKAGQEAKARIPVTVEEPFLWDDENPMLYTVRAKVKDEGIFRGRLLRDKHLESEDQQEVLFGIRTVSADATRGLLVNGHCIKLKGGCLHHDNGILGAVSLYDSEYRKLKIHKENGFNAVRTSHNPPSAVFLEACDRLGLYVIDEAFDAWGMAKQPGDYSQFFEHYWKEDMESFIVRDRNHPSIIMWSTGNEIPERGGMGEGYVLAQELAGYVRSLDKSRLVTNGMCSFWNGLDDETQSSMTAKFDEARAQGNVQNAQLETAELFEERSDAFLSPLDVVGLNYLENYYERFGEKYPERVIVGTESFAKSIDYIWKLVEKLPYVIGDFTWTSFDYIGEAGIGKSVFMSRENQNIGKMDLMSQGSEYPWRLANDADFDINGVMMPQGGYRKVVWGSNETFLYIQDPVHFGECERVSGWGWPRLSESWNWRKTQGKPVKVVVYSGAEEVELFLNGKSLERKRAGKDNRYTAEFVVNYEPGILEAVSYRQEKRISSKSIATTGLPDRIMLHPERTVISANGESLAYISVEIMDKSEQWVPDASVLLEAHVQGAAVLAGFGSAKPISEEKYTEGCFTSYHGRALAVLRAGYEAGEATLTVSGEGVGTKSVIINVCK